MTPTLILKCLYVGNSHVASPIISTAELDIIRCNKGHSWTDGTGRTGLWDSRREEERVGIHRSPTLATCMPSPEIKVVLLLL